LPFLLLVVVGVVKKILKRLGRSSVTWSVFYQSLHFRQQPTGVPCKVATWWQVIVVMLYPRLRLVDDLPHFFGTDEPIFSRSGYWSEAALLKDGHHSGAGKGEGCGVFG
jgi:hypothetical protein